MLGPTYVRLDGKVKLNVNGVEVEVWKSIRYWGKKYGAVNVTFICKAGSIEAYADRLTSDHVKNKKVVKNVLHAKGFRPAKALVYWYDTPTVLHKYVSPQRRIDDKLALVNYEIRVNK